LQDQVLLYGTGNSRFFFKKNAVEDKNLGFFIKSIMTRCIHCTRCIRFSKEIVGFKILGALNRGQKTEIGPYISSLFLSNLSGNIIDLCPVGALTSRLYAFKGRPWELKINESIDLTDSNSSSITIAVKELNIVRILPKKNKILNNCIISDKARFSFDAVTNLRLLESFWKNKIWNPLNFQTLFSNLMLELKFLYNLFLIPEDLDYQNLLCLIHLEKISNNKIKLFSINISKLAITNFYLTNQYSCISKFEQGFKYCYLLSSNLQFENIILNTKIRTKYFQTNIPLFSAGFSYSSQIPNFFITLNLNSLFKFFESKNFFALYFFKKFNQFNSWFILGSSLNKRLLNFDTFLFFKKMFPQIHVLNLNKFANSESFVFLNISFINTNILEKSKNIFAWNLEETLYLHELFLFFKKNIYWVNSHSSQLFKRTTCILPTLTFFEKDGLFLNFEGKPQKAFKSIVNLNKNIISLDFFLFFFRKEGTHKKQPAFFYFFEMCDQLLYIKMGEFYFSPIICLDSISTFIKYPLKPSFEDFYQTDAFTRNSLNMLKRSKELRKVSTNFF